LAACDWLPLHCGCHSLRSVSARDTSNAKR